MELLKIGLTVTNFAISSFNYPEKIQKMIEKNASNEMVGDVSKYRDIGMVDAMVNNPGGGMSEMAQTGAGMAMGIEMMKQMTRSMSDNNDRAPQAGTIICSGCNQPVNENMKFCSNCGAKIVKAQASSSGDSRFCHNCGTKLVSEAKYCS